MKFMFEWGGGGGGGGRKQSQMFQREQVSIVVQHFQVQVAVWTILNTFI